MLNEDKILVIESIAGDIGFPKGHVEKGETEEETAIREVKEETGIDIEVDTSKRYTINYSPRENVDKDVVFFIGKPIGGELKPQLEEIKATYYMPIDEVYDKIPFENNKAMFREVLQDIKKIKG